MSSRPSLSLRGAFRSRTDRIFTLCAADDQYAVVFSTHSASMREKERHKPDVFVTSAWKCYCTSAGRPPVESSLNAGVRHATAWPGACLARCEIFGIDNDHRSGLMYKVNLLLRKYSSQVISCITSNIRVHSKFLTPCLFFSCATSGFYAGFIASAFTFGRFLAGYPLGYAADVVGRKPVIVSGLVSIIVFSLAFGFSPTLTWAILSR